MLFMTYQKNKTIEYTKRTWVVALLLSLYYQSTSKGIPNLNKLKDDKYFAPYT